MTITLSLWTILIGIAAVVALCIIVYALFFYKDQGDGWWSVDFWPLFLIVLAVVLLLGAFAVRGVVAVIHDWRQEPPHAQ